MSDLKLAKLPDRIPVKIIVNVSPELNRVLQNYASLYQEAYGQQESITELIPFMLNSFLQGDRNFAKAVRKKRKQPAVPAALSTPQGQVKKNG